MTDLEYHYLQISNIHDKHYKKNRERLQKIMIAKGVTTEMLSDLLLWEKENKRTVKSKRQLDRLFLLEEALDVFDVCASTADQTEVLLNLKTQEIESLLKANEELRKELETTKQFYESEKSI